MERPRPPFSDVERQLLALFFDVLFKPIVAILRPALGKEAEIRNAPADALTSALRSGRVQYADGVFSGRLSATISGALRDLGATFDKRAGVYNLPISKVPPWVIAQATAFNSKAQALHEQVVSELDRVQETLNVQLFDRPVNLAPTVSKIESEWRTAAEQLEIKPTLLPSALETIRREWAETAKLPIKKFAVEEVQALRKTVQDNAERGYRIDRLLQGIGSRYGVSQRKAKFLARNETSIFMSKFRRERFQEAGVRRYTWSTSEDSRVRPALGLTPKEREHAGNHRRLNGKVFFFNSPPVVDPNTGRRKNPGEDYNCRCVAIPVLDEAVTTPAS